MFRERDALKEADGEPLLATGFYVIHQARGELFYHCEDGDYVVNLTDMQNTKHHPNRSRLNGCCGLDGCDGVNTLCINGHEVGTEHSDCWMPHFMALPPGLVIQTDEPESVA